MRFRLLNSRSIGTSCIFLAGLVVVGFIGKADALCRAAFRLHSEVAGPRVQLSDLADLQCPEAPELTALDLGEAAHFGLTRVVDVERLISGPLAPWQGKLVVISPGRTLQVTTASDTLSPPELQALLDGLYANETLGEGMTRKADIPKPPQAITLPKGERELSLVFSGLKRSGKVPLELRVGVGGRWVRRWALTAQVRVFSPVAVALALIKRGEIFTPGNIGEEIRDVTNYASGVLPTKAACLGKPASVTVTPGRMLTLRLVEMPALFKAGESIPLIVRQGAVTVAIDAVARRDGRAGEIIPAWNPVNQRMIHGQVLSDGSLRLLPEGG